MAEEKKNAAPTEMFNDDGGKNPDYKPPAGSESETDTKKLDKDGKEIVDDKKGEGQDEFDDKVDPEKPPEIPIRRSTASNIIARQGKKIEKLRSKLKEGDEGYVAPTDEKEEEEDTNLSDDAVKAIDTKVKKAIAPLLGELASKADEAEMQALIVSEPEAKKYVNHIKAYMEHEAYKNVSPTVIYHHLAFTAAQALGAKRKKAADLDAEQKKSGGRTIVDTGTVGGIPSAQDITDMTDAEFEKMEQDALQGKFLQR